MKATVITAGIVSRLRPLMQANRVSRFLMLYLTVGYFLLIYSLLYYYSAMAYCYRWNEILFAFSILAVMIFFSSLILAVVSRGIEGVLSLFTTRLKKISIYTLTSIIALFFIIWIVIRYGYLFIQTTPYFTNIFDLYRNLGLFIINSLRVGVLALIFVLIFLLRKKILPRFEEFISIFSYCAILLFLTSVIVVVIMLFSVRPAEYYKRVAPQQKIAAGRGEKYNIILLTCESLSAPHMALYGYNRNTTPNINNLAKESYVFINMHAASDVTDASLPSIIEGIYPSEHKKFYSSFFINPKRSAENLCDVLSSAGYKTYAADIPSIKGYGYKNSFYHIQPSLGEPGILERASLRYNIPLHAWYINVIDSDVIVLREIVLNVFRSIFGIQLELRKGDRDVADNYLRSIEHLIINAKEPYFIWTHPGYLRRPYIPPRAYRGIFSKEEIYISERKQFKFQGFYPANMQSEIDKIRDGYDESILFLDDKIESIIRFLVDNGIYDKCILIITSDHGQSFKKGYLGHHGPFLYEELIHVPLIIHIPNQREGERIETRAEHVDIAPTILELCGINKPAHMSGESLVRYMENPTLITDKPKFSMTLRIIKNQITGGAAAVFKGDYKLICDLDKEKTKLYKINDDPEEAHDISSEHREKVMELKQIILERIRRSQ